MDPSSDRPSAAQVLVRHPQAVLSHEEAATALGMSLLDSIWTPALTVPRSHSRIVVPGWKVYRRDVKQRVLADGRRVTHPGQTIVDLARTLPLNHAVATGDSALRAKLVTAPLLADLARTARGRGRREIVAVIGLLDPLSGSVLESLLRVLLVTAGLPAPTTQASILDGLQEVARVDFCWRAQRLIVEVDGYAFHSDRAAYRSDREKMNTFERLGWRVLRFTWEDVVSRPDHVVRLVSQCLALAA